jgi:hypothetical protein
MQCHDDAVCHFEHALAMNERMGARPWLARTQREYSRLLGGREMLSGRERQRAEDLLAAARVTYRELGMREPD